MYHFLGYIGWKLISEDVFCLLDFQLFSGDLMLLPQLFVIAWDDIFYLCANHSQWVLPGFRSLSQFTHFFLFFNFAYTWLYCISIYRFKKYGTHSWDFPNVKAFFFVWSNQGVRAKSHMLPSQHRLRVNGVSDPLQRRNGTSATSAPELQSTKPKLPFWICLGMKTRWSTKDTLVGWVIEGIILPNHYRDPS